MRMHVATFITYIPSPAFGTDTCKRGFTDVGAVTVLTVCYMGYRVHVNNKFIM